MKFRTFMLLATIIAIIFGLGFLFIPSTLMGFYGVKLNEPGRFVALYFGSALLGVAVTWWTARSARSLSDALKGGILGGLVISITGLFVAFMDALTGPANGFIWINPIIYAFLTIGFGYYYFKKLD